MAIESTPRHAGGREAAPPLARYWVYADGEYLRYEDVRIGLLTHAFMYGTACFEGLRAYWNAEREQLYLLQAPEHYERLARSARILRMAPPPSPQVLTEATCEVLRRNGFRQTCFLRAAIYKSDEEIGVRLAGLRDTVAICAMPFEGYFSPERGLRCMTSAWRRISDQAFPARAKIAGSYVNSALAKSDALAAGYDEAILLTADGHVSEASVENLFLVSAGRLVTPPVTDDILEGVTRRLVMELARGDLGLPVVERPVDRTELYTCDEVLLCGSAAQVIGVTEIDHRPVGDGRIGTVTRALQDAFFRAVTGEHERSDRLVAPVYR
jgi:branched-chain amino acid aminotransferase